MLKMALSRSGDIVCLSLTSVNGGILLAQYSGLSCQGFILEDVKAWSSRKNIGGENPFWLMQIGDEICVNGKLLSA